MPTLRTLVKVPDVTTYPPAAPSAAMTPYNSRTTERWFELYRTGKRKEAAAQLAAESRRSKLATDAAIDARLQELARSRG
jgi:hypothetical protein